MFEFYEILAIEDDNPLRPRLQGLLEGWGGGPQTQRNLCSSLDMQQPTK